MKRYLKIIALLMELMFKKEKNYCSLLQSLIICFATARDFSRRVAKQIKEGLKKIAFFHVTHLRD